MARTIDLERQGQQMATRLKRARSMLALADAALIEAQRKRNLAFDALLRAEDAEREHMLDLNLRPR